MKALITGGSSGIGKDIAIELGKKGYDLYIISRKYGDIDQIKEKVKTEVNFLSFDLSREEECFRLLDETKDIDFDIFINNAGFGDIGYILKTDTSKQINMIKLNDLSSFILGKEFLKRFINKNKGYILFVASAAAFGVAPYMAEYYASKAFVYSLAHGYYREVKDMHKDVHISVLCPGPVKTRFEEKSGAKFNVSSLKSEYVAKYAVKKMFKNKLEIVPGIKIKLAHVFAHIVPKKFISKVLRKQSEIKD